MANNRTEGRVFVIVLGTMQDAGLPHIACACGRCTRAREDPRQRRYAAALGLIDARAEPERAWLFDATPDIGEQLHLLAPWLRPDSDRDRLRQPDGIFLTHGHMGHTLGLALLGPEGMNVKALPIYAPPGLVSALHEMALWRPLLSHLSLIALAEAEPLRLDLDLVVTPLAVPHRDEVGTGTFAFRIQGPQQTLLYVPDIDRWEAWAGARQEIAGADVALLDGSFFTRDELGRIGEVPHPLVPDTLSFVKGVPTTLYFTHLNHTNALLEPGSKARAVIDAAGVGVVQQGQCFFL
jgi:pyrroloquinoline quinone biosynthesis protein B